MSATSRVMVHPLREGTMDAPLPVRRGAAADRDAALVERLRQHEEGAAEALVAEYGNRAYRLAMRITNNSSDAEEVVQDALWAASRKIETFRGTAAFGSWVYRITANAAYQKRRARRHDRDETSWEDLAPTFDETGRPVQGASDWSPRLHDPALQSELHAVLRSAIDELPGEHRATFLLHDVEGLSNPEIAETLQIKTATVKSRVHRARLFLRGRLAVYLGRTPALT
jgi:RNA polymerase sigma-70 factor (ECF subfamily)